MTQEEIIEGCKRCDPVSQQALVHQYSPYLMTIARRYAPDTDTAYDILQDAFIRILKFFPNYDHVYANPMPWLKKIVTNTALTHLQKLKSKPVILPDFLPDKTDESMDPLSNMSLDEICGLIARLPDGYREVFNLAIIEQYNHQEISQMLGITESTSRSQLVRARRWMQNQILNLQKVRV